MKSTIKGREQIAVLKGAYTHPIIPSGYSRVTYCGIPVTYVSKTAVAEEFDCPTCRKMAGS